MTTNEDVRVGEQVRLLQSGSRGIVRELDHSLHVARIEVGVSGAERWVKLDEIARVLPWYLRRDG